MCDFSKIFSNFVIMKPANTIIAHPASNDKLEALKAFMNALHIKFEVRPADKSPYDPEFVDMILQGDKDLEDDKGKKTTLDELDKLWK
jgi:hypothetical protein